MPEVDLVFPRAWVEFQDPADESQDNLPDNSNPDPGAPEDQDDDTQDPD